MLAAIPMTTSRFIRLALSAAWSRNIGWNGTPTTSRCHGVEREWQTSYKSGLPFRQPLPDERRRRIRLRPQNQAAWLELGYHRMKSVPIQAGLEADSM